MRIDGNGDTKIVPLVQPAKASSKPAIEAESPQLTGSARLLSSLKALPDMRAEKVAQAKALVQDPSYPSDEALGKVADTLAGSIGAVGESE
jgi:hypothetical protein